MSKSSFSAQWPDHSADKPRLRAHCRVSQQFFRGVRTPVLHDVISGQHHRLSEAAAATLGLMDGHRTMDEIWREGCRRYEENSLTQDEILGLVSRLYQAGALAGEGRTDHAELAARAARVGDLERKGRFRNPLAMRFPLWDPERFLARTEHLVGWVFSWIGAVLFAAVALAGATGFLMNMDALNSGLVDQIISAENIAILLLVYPFVKAIHELGHAYAVRRWGGEVHELGIMFLIFFPVPYVNASAATAFRDKRKRALVGAMGILVEFFLAAFATLVWISVEPGVTRAVAFNIMLIGGVSTILFNGNPLLKFDGYYVLADFLEIPNLASRSAKYVIYLVQRYLLGLQTASSPAYRDSERKWLASYAVLAYCYRVLVVATIVFLLVSSYFIVGVVLASWSVYLMFVRPLLRGLKFLIFDGQLAAGRVRALMGSGLVVLVLGAFLFVLPFPYATVTEGIIWIPEEAQLRFGADGEVVELLAPAGSTVKKGQPLIRLANPFLEARLVLLKAEETELKARLQDARVRDRVTARMIEEQLGQTRRNLEDAAKRVADLTVISPASGKMALPIASDIIGQYYFRGQTAGFVIMPGPQKVRAVVPQHAVDRLQATDRIEVRRAHRRDLVEPATMIRMVPTATVNLPSPVLGVAGGGNILMDPMIEIRPTALSPFFILELDVTSDSATYVGERLYVRIRHGAKPLGLQAVQFLQRLFLRELNV